MFGTKKLKAYTFFGQMMTVPRAKKMLEEKKKELVDTERQCIRGLHLDYNQIVDLKAKCSRLDKEIRAAEKKIAERE